MALDIPWLVLAQLGGGGNPYSTAIFVGLLFVIMWVMVISPQRKQAAQQRTLMASLQKGDEVVTGGGLLGRIVVVSDKVVTLEVASGVKVRVLKSSVQSKVNISEPAAGVEPEKKEVK